MGTDSQPPLTPEGMPPSPWGLHWRHYRKVGRSADAPAPVETIHDNALWLKALQRDVSRGINSPRYHTGALQADLAALARELSRLNGKAFF